MADNTPVENSTSELKADTSNEVKPEVATKEPLQVPPTSEELLKKAEEAKKAREAANSETEEEKKEVPDVKEEEDQTAQEAEVEESEDDKQLLKKRLKGAITEIEKKNEESRKMVSLQSELVRENPELIHRIATTDPILANKVVMSVWGNEGIKSYKQLLEHAKLEELKESNPDLYEIKKETAKLKAELEERKERDKKEVEREFCESKGIVANEYDPKYMTLKETMETLNPKLVAEDYKKALEISHKIAFSGVKTSKQQPAPTVAIGGGTPPPPTIVSKPSMDSRSTWLDSQLSALRRNRNGNK